MTFLVNPFVFGGSLFDVSSFEYASKSFSFAAQETNPWVVEVGDNDSKCYTVGTINDKIYQYSLSTPGDINTASYSSKSFDLSGQVTSAQGLRFKPDGTKFYVQSGTGNTISEYDCSTAWDVSTASYSGNALGSTGGPRGIDFNTDGTKAFIASQSGGLREYALSSAWDISSASLTTTLDVSGQSTNVGNCLFVSGGKSLLVPDIGGNIYQYDLTTAFDTTTATYATLTLAQGQGDTDARSVRANSNETILYIMDGNDIAYQYEA